MEELRNQQIVSLDAMREGKRMAAAIAANAQNPMRQDDLDPVHALFIHVMNTVSDLFTSLQHLPEMAPLVKRIESTLDDFAPFDQFGPPATPITRSFFNGWAFLDLFAGRDSESVASVIIESAPLLHLDSEWVKVLRVLAHSRMGLYEFIGEDGKFVLLKELLTGREFRCATPLSYRGNTGSLWFVRLLPHPYDATGYHVIFTTPYVFASTEKESWLACFKRLLPKTKFADSDKALRKFFKLGFSPQYWVEFVFEAYLNHLPDACFLSGVPDISLSRPHSRDTERATDRENGADQDPLVQMAAIFQSLIQNGMRPEEIPKYLMESRNS
jgi:hypothetical protein